MIPQLASLRLKASQVVVLKVSAAHRASKAVRQVEDVVSRAALQGSADEKSHLRRSGPHFGLQNSTKYEEHGSHGKDTIGRYAI